VTNPDLFSRFRFSTEQGVRGLLSRLRPSESLAPAGQSTTAFLDWRLVNQVGVPKIDEQHRLLVNLINRFHQVLVRERNRSMADDLFQYFMQVARTHFSFEEAMLMEHGCPGYEEHFHQHSDAMAEVQDLHRQFKAGGLSAPVLLNSLRSWMLSHTRGSDQRHARYMNQLGLHQG
jgi:hemerythrin